jgi:predicted transposase/invertase (TIGR01784 family)
LTLLDRELKLFYDYICNGEIDSRLTERINSSITKIKEDRETRRKYMTYTTRMAEAKSEAREEGIKYGIAIGEERGRNEGAQQKAVETAKNMKLENMPISMIAHFTGLSVEEIEKL